MLLYYDIKYFNNIVECYQVIRILSGQLLPLFAVFKNNLYPKIT